MKTTKVQLSEVNIDGGTQSREKINNETVATYADAYTDGADIPAIVVFNDGLTLWLADGFHRFHAAKRLKFAELPAEVHTGTQDDAKWYSYGANKTQHALSRTNKDKIKAVRLALSHPNAVGMSDYLIAEHVGVNHSTITRHRPQVECSTVAEQQLETANRVGKDGKSRAPRKAPKPKPETIVVADTTQNTPISAQMDNRSLTRDERMVAPVGDIYTKPKISGGCTFNPAEFEAVAAHEAAEAETETTDDVIEELESVGNVPAHLAPIIAQKKEVKALIADIGRIQGRITRLVATPAGVRINLADCERLCGQLQTELRFSSFYCNCPGCKNKLDKKCPKCKGSGWLTKSIYGMTTTDEEKAWLKAT